MTTSTRNYNRQFVASKPTVPRGTHFVLRRNATSVDLAHARHQEIGTAYRLGGTLYRMTEMYLDDLNRLIGVGEPIESAPQALPADEPGEA